MGSLPRKHFVANNPQSATHQYGAQPRYAPALERVDRKVSPNEKILVEQKRSEREFARAGGYPVQVDSRVPHWHGGIQDAKLSRIPKTQGDGIGLPLIRQHPERGNAPAPEPVLRSHRPSLDRPARHDIHKAELNILQHEWFPDSFEEIGIGIDDHFKGGGPLYVSPQPSRHAEFDLDTSQPPASSSEPNFNSKPLKSAMKKPGSSGSKKQLRHAPSSKWSKKLDFASFMPRNRSPGTLEPDETSDFDSQEPTRMQLKRRTGTGRMEVLKEKLNPMLEARQSVSQRPKVFDKEIFDAAKVTSRRPPKGIQNWFDGFDISSDEEDTRRTSRIRIESSRPAELPAEAPVRSDSPIREQLPSVFSPMITHDAVPAAVPKQRSSSSKNVHATTSRTESRKPELKHRHSDKKSGGVRLDPHSAHTHCAVDSKQQRNGGSRLGHSPLGSISVLSLSSDSDDDDVHVDRPSLAGNARSSDNPEAGVSASSITFQRPEIPPRKIHTARSVELKRIVSEKISSFGPEPARREQLRREESHPLPLLGSDRDIASGNSDLSRSYRQQQPKTRKDQSIHRRTTSRTTGTLSTESPSAAGETASSFPSAGSGEEHVMTVTEEEMVLLELMRQKRAAMRKNSFSEGYRLALMEEQMYLRRKREGAHREALAMLQFQEELARAAKSRASQHEKKPSGSKSEAFSLNNHGSNGSFVTLESKLSPKQIRKVSAIRTEEMENALRLERFLRQQSPVDDEYPTSLPESFPTTSAAMFRPPEWISSPTSEETVPFSSKKRGSMHRYGNRHGGQAALSGQRDSYATTFEEQYLDEQRDRLRSYVEAQNDLDAEIDQVKKSEEHHDAARPAHADYNHEPEAEQPEPPAEGEYDNNTEDDGFSDKANDFPAPPSHRNTLDQLSLNKQMQLYKRMSLIDSLVLEREEPVVPDIPQRHPSRPEFPGPERPSTAVLRRSVSYHAGDLENRADSEVLDAFDANEFPRIRPQFRRHASSSLVSPLQDSGSNTWNSALPSQYGSHPSSAKPVSPLSSEFSPNVFPDTTIPAAKSGNGEKGSNNDHSGTLTVSSDGRSTFFPQNFDLKPRPSKERVRSSMVDPADAKATLERMTSIGSITSASEDVMAAWAELGGESDTFAARMRRPKQEGTVKKKANKGK